jgi:hypothetical protein
MRRGRLFIIALLICSLALAGVSRYWAERWRAAAALDPLLPASARRDSASGLSNMDSYALALLLGGLRGPLVMFLWSTSEAQKSAHDLEDFDTKVEWIRLLQPEFDTVHLFQIWNKAYNVSVQMANLPNKYAAILDGLDYARSVDQQRPDDINIIDAIGNLYGDKLGGLSLPAPEKAYYLRRVRQDTSALETLTQVRFPASKLDAVLAVAHTAGMDEPVEAEESNDASHQITLTVYSKIADRMKAALNDPEVVYHPLPPPRPVAETEFRRTRLNPMLDESGNILPRLLTPVYPRPAELAAQAPWYDGSTLQFLAKYQPFSYGLTPEALGYNYSTRAQMLQSVAHETHIQRSEYVIDSRPALALKSWATEQATSGRRSELRLFGMDDKGDRLDLEQRAPGATPHTLANAAELEHRPDPAAGPEALYEYTLSARIFGDARLELLRVLSEYPDRRDTFLSHVDDCDAYQQLSLGDHDFLQGLLDPTARTTEWQSAADHYTKSDRAFDLILFRYYFDDAFVRAEFPTDPATHEPYRRESIDRMPAEQRDALLDKALADAPEYFKNKLDQFTDDRADYLVYRGRCQARLAEIAAVGTFGPGQALGGR